MRKSKGFTLIELLVVIAIIALLLAILMPSLRMAKEHAKRLLCGKDLSSIGVALSMYAGQEDDYLPPPLYARSDNNWHAHYFGHFKASLVGNSRADERLESLLGMNSNTPPEPNANNLAYLMRTDLIDPSYPEIFYCKSSKGSAFSIEEYGNEQWPDRPGATAAPQWNRIHITYSYLPQHRYKKNPDLPGFPATAKKYSVMDPARSVVMDILEGYPVENSSTAMAHSSNSYVGVNVLYGDGSVTFNRDDKSAGLLREKLLDGSVSPTIPGLRWRGQIKGIE